MQLDSALGSPVEAASEWGVGKLSSAVATATRWNGLARNAWVDHAVTAGADGSLAREGYAGAQQIVTMAAQVVPVGRAVGVVAAGLRTGTLSAAAIPLVVNNALGSDTVSDLARDRANSIALPFTQSVVNRVAPTAREVMSR